MGKKKKYQKTPAPVAAEEAVQAEQGKAPAPEKKARVAPQPTAPTVSQRDNTKWWLPLVLSLGFFIASVFSPTVTIKPLVMFLIVAAVISCFIRLGVFGKRITLPMLAVALWVLMNGISCFYAISGKFALREFLRIMAGYCGFLLILAWSREGTGRGRVAAGMLEGGVAFASLVSIDQLSTHLLSGPFFKIMHLFSEAYDSIAQSGVEAGSRMLSIYTNPNTFAGLSGLVVLLGLEMVVTSERKKERRFHLVCLFVNALAFLLVFSMGASATIAIAFLAFLFLERRERKGTLLVLMIETFALVLLCAFPIFLTSFETWSGFQPIPLLCAVAGSVLLCVIHERLGLRLADRLAGRGKWLPAIIGGVLALLAVFAVLGVTLTGPATLAAGESLRRADYPAPGTYTLQVDADVPVTVYMESQNQEETMMHTGTSLYSGDAQGATFTVPEDSMVVYFTISAQEAGTIRSVSYAGENGSGSLKLHYKILPGFIANRLQGIRANENAIQRTVFFADGMKLFRESPIIGQGLGAFESGVRHVQSFEYVTKYCHDHYIETLISTGIVGLVFYVGMLVLCAVAVWKSLRREDGDPMAPGLGAALIFMSAHAVVELAWSASFYLPVAIGVLALICVCCGEELPIPVEKEDVRGWITVALSVLAIGFAVTLYFNMWAAKVVEQTRSGDTFSSLKTAAKYDLYEYADYKLTYVYLAMQVDRDQNPEIASQADQFAAELGRMKSNSIPIRLADYYFYTGEQRMAFDMLEQYLNYVPAYTEAWRNTFLLLEAHSVDTPEYRAEVEKLYGMLQAWNEANMGKIKLTEENQAYIDSVLA